MSKRLTIEEFIKTLSKGGSGSSGSSDEPLVIGSYTPPFADGPMYKVINGSYEAAYALLTDFIEYPEGVTPEYPLVKKLPTGYYLTMSKYGLQPSIFTAWKIDTSDNGVMATTEGGDVYKISTDGTVAHSFPIG